MATNPIPDVSPEESPFSREEWWALFDELRLSQQADYAEYGGPVAFIRRERDADADQAKDAKYGDRA